MWPQLSLDVSNYQKYLNDEFFERWSAVGYGGLIAQAVVGLDGRSYTSQQLQMALDHKWSIASYVWCSSGDAMTDWRFNQRVALLEPFVDKLSFLAVDVEEYGLAPEDVDADLLRADEVKGDSPIYSGKWFFDNQGWSNEIWWAARRLWDSAYDNVADVDAGWKPYGGWVERWLKQFSDDPLDLNVCRQS